MLVLDGDKKKQIQLQLWTLRFQKLPKSSRVLLLHRSEEKRFHQLRALLRKCNKFHFSQKGTEQQFTACGVILLINNVQCVCFIADLNIAVVTGYPNECKFLCDKAAMLRVMIKEIPYMCINTNWRELLETEIIIPVLRQWLRWASLCLVEVQKQYSQKLRPKAENKTWHRVTLNILRDFLFQAISPGRNL
jgi:hypothetical protein